MIPVDQTTFGAPGGNCFSAAVASILELPIADVPYFMGPDDWWPPFLEWLRARDWCAAYVCEKDLGGRYPSDFHILSGRSARGPHVVIASGGEMVHDPNPKRDGLLPGTVDGAFILFPLASPTRTT